MTQRTKAEPVAASFLGGPWHERQNITVTPGTHIIRVPESSGHYESKGMTFFEATEVLPRRVVEVHYWWTAGHSNPSGTP